MVVRKHFYFSGRVQGVGFRFQACMLARSLGLTGYVQNLWDGRVEMEAQGEEKLVWDLISALHKQLYIVIEDMDVKDMELKKEVYWKILRNQLTVFGTWNSSFTQEDRDDWHYVLKRLAQGNIDPGGMISHRFLLEELERGLRLMRDKTEDYVKVMGVFGEGRGKR